jgi:CBS domain-containing protein
VMRTNVAALPASGKLGEVLDFLRVDIDHPQDQRLLPVVDGAGALVGVLTRADMREAIARANAGGGARDGEICGAYIAGRYVEGKGAAP